MIRAKIANLIDLAIEAGSNSAADLSDAFTALHESLEAEGKEGTLRHFFDCWSDALNHNFGVYKTKNPSELSGGMRKRAAIARSLMIEPDILLYDEPTAELDQINTGIIANIILDLKKAKPITQLVVTHDISFAFAIADTISILEDGLINISGKPEEIKEINHPLLKPIA